VNETTLSTQQSQISPIGYTSTAVLETVVGKGGIGEALRKVDTPYMVLAGQNGPCLAPIQGMVSIANEDNTVPVLGYVSALSPENLGDNSFCHDLGIRYPYVAGAMANGIASVELVIAMNRAGMLGFFGAAGLPVVVVESAVDRLIEELGDTPFGVNVIHSPNEPDVEMGIVNLMLEKGVHLVEASAFLKITSPIVKYRLSGIYRDEDGAIVTPNHVIAKVSRQELAEKFLSPAPAKIVEELLAAGEITVEEAQLSQFIPVAQDISAEADSGGHTDHRPALSLLPTLLQLKDRMQAEHDYAVTLRVGLGGGISTPASALAAFSMGAAYVVTGTVNQACQESGTSDIVRQMLAETRQADVAKAPAADMFEMGVTVQVVKRGTMFAMRGNKLFELYRAYNSLEEIPDDEREKLEKQIFRASFAEVWAGTKAFFEERDPRQNERAERDPKHKMALVFRSYLGQASMWANRGVEDRKMDYQIWCGPAMGAFNEWASQTFLEDFKQREVEVVGKNILYGTAVLSRVHQTRQLGLSIPSEVLNIKPQPLESIQSYF
jgi:trans-AT polyketide synthase, acyltransferase and oxidoreductase domains